ncbi:MAG: hypothetical protein KJ771_00665 [Nanoarchaeota archaeon]|nr:hypothetical protein [Nanoarchaeota archaeon]
MNKEKYIKWYKITKEIVNNDSLVPKRSDQEILKLVSQEDWLMFVLKKFDNTEEAKNAPTPNVFMNLYKNDNKNFCRIGVTFNNVGGVDVLKNILSKYCKDEKEALTKSLLSLDGSWEIVVSRKIKEYNWAQTPEYVEEFHINSNQINDKIVDQIISWVNKIREEGTEKRLSKKVVQETPSVNLLEAIFELNEDEFRKRMKEAFEVLQVCLEVKPNSEIRKIVKSKENELQELEEKHESLMEKWSKRESYLSLGVATQEQINNLEKEIKEIEDKINKLKEELKD